MIVLGFGVFFSGLNFKSSTFWNGEALVGDFYRPIMTTIYAFVYTFFGANPIILKAAAYGPIPPALYSAIRNQQSLDIPIPDSTRVIHIR